jgi:hypothetical protein
MQQYSEDQGQDAAAVVFEGEAALEDEICGSVVVAIQKILRHDLRIVESLPISIPVILRLNNEVTLLRYDLFMRTLRTPLLTGGSGSLKGNGLSTMTFRNPNFVPRYARVETNARKLANRCFLL